MISLLGSSNPLAQEWMCGRQRCLLCKGRHMMSEEEESRPPQHTGSPPLPKPSGEDVRTIPKCTTEGVGYMLDLLAKRETLQI